MSTSKFPNLISGRSPCSKLAGSEHALNEQDVIVPPFGDQRINVHQSFQQNRGLVKSETISSDEIQNRKRYRKSLFKPRLLLVQADHDGAHEGLVREGSDSGVHHRNMTPFVKDGVELILFDVEVVGEKLFPGLVFLVVNDLLLARNDAHYSILELLAKVEAINFKAGRSKKPKSKIPSKIQNYYFDTFPTVQATTGCTLKEMVPPQNP